MTFLESLDYIQTLETKALTPDHQNSLNLMAYLGNPQDSMPVIHVAGTNGKGSTIAFMKAIYMAEGYKVGTFTSPHILSPLELVSIGNDPLSAWDFACAISQVKKTCDAMVKDGLNHPTAFECLTAASLLHLSESALDVALIEVGMGGRFDATNVFNKPLLTVITAIDFDHTAILGHTLKEIAWHKGGIIKTGVPSVIGPNPMDVIEAISDCVRAVDGCIYLLDAAFIHETVLLTTNGTKLFHLETNFYAYKGLQTSMIGKHQTINLATALLALHQLKSQLNFSESAVKQGVKNTRWTCRNDLIAKHPMIMVDGGHNPNAIEAIRQMLLTNFKDKKIITVLGLLADKNYVDMIAQVNAFSDYLILTEPLSPRALSLNSLENPTLEMMPDYKEALKKALSHCDDTTLLLVLGSLYLAYPAKEWLLSHLRPKA